MLHSRGGRIPAGVLPNYSLVKSVLSWWSVLTCCVHQIELRLHAKPEGRNPPKTDASRWFSLYRMLCLSPRHTSGRHHPHSIVSPCFTLLATCFPFHIICSQVLMPATFRRSPEVPCPEHINKRECQTVVIGVFFRVYWINACLYGCFCGLGIDVGGFASVPSLFEEQPADATNQCDGAWLSCTTDRKF